VIPPTARPRHRLPDVDQYFPRYFPGSTMAPEIPAASESNPAPTANPSEPQQAQPEVKEPQPQRQQPARGRPARPLRSSSGSFR
jgi:hypothetical protein